VVSYPIRSYIPEHIFKAYNVSLPTSENPNPGLDIKGLLNDIRYRTVDEALPVNSNFAIIHHRIVSIDQPCHVLNNEKDENNLKSIIDKVKDKYETIFIFCKEKRPRFKLESTDIIYVNQLDVYASLMHHEKCDIVISEWSGAGQLSHYCHNKKVMYYFHHYEEHGYSSGSSGLLKMAESGIYDAFDFHRSTDLDIFLYKTIDDLLDAV
jgi:hypothetical protein